jgi:hypothetical protein
MNLQNTEVIQIYKLILKLKQKSVTGEPSSSCVHMYSPNADKSV